MTLDEIVALARAGYTKSEIAALTAAPKEPAKAEPAKPAEPKTDPAKAEPAKAEPAKAAEPKTDPAKAAPASTDPFAAFNEAAEKALAAFTEKLEKITTLAGMPSIGSVEPKGVEDIISGFLKEV